MAVKKNLVANYIGQGWNAIMGLAFIPLYVKYLGVEAYGLVGLFVLLQTLLSLLDVGLTPTLGREMARFTGGGRNIQSMRDLLRTVELMAVGVAFLTAVCIFLGANWIASDWLKADDLSNDAIERAIQIMAFVAGLRFLEGVYRSALVGLQRQVLINKLIVVISTLRNLGAVGVLVWLSPTIEAFFLWQGAISLLGLFLFVIATYSSLPITTRNAHFSFKLLFGVWQFAAGMLGITILSCVLTQADKIILSNFLTLTEFGHYTLATSVAGSLFFLAGPITQAFYPKFCALYAENNTVALVDYYHKSAQLVSVTIGGCAIVLIFFSETFLLLWTRDYALAKKVEYLLSLLIFGNLLNCLVLIPYQLQLAFGWVRLSVYVNIVAIIILIPMNVWAIDRFGTLGAAWSWIALNAGYILIAMQIMYKKILKKEKWDWYIKDISMPICCIALAVGLFKFISPSPKTLYEQMVVLLTATLIAIGVGSLASYQLRAELLKIIHFMQRKKWKIFQR